MRILNGIDIIRISRIKNIIEKFGDKFINRVFLPNEIKYCESRGNKAIHYAVRIAAKEAVAKALGTGISKDISWKDIEVVNNDTGKPEVILHNEAKNVLKRMGGYDVSLSLSHEGNNAVAQVIILIKS
ncbi:holo-[acyl-carrier-protein] synthase [Thermoanaerobacteraceae bacterium SP2]|nr:holo-[acyl-carrier-protein] synthase [Thermoanaerobacteraceae bacterium SP2]